MSFSLPLFILGLQEKGINRTLELEMFKLVNNSEEISSNICGRSYISKRNLACYIFDCLLTVGNTNPWIKTVPVYFDNGT